MFHRRVISAFSLGISLALCSTAFAKTRPDEQLVYKKTPQGALKLHVFYPGGRERPAADAAPRPGIVFFFGGGWKGGSPGQFYEHCKYPRLPGNGCDWVGISHVRQAQDAAQGVLAGRQIGRAVDSYPRERTGNRPQAARGRGRLGGRTSGRPRWGALTGSTSRVRTRR